MLHLVVYLLLNVVLGATEAAPLLLSVTYAVSFIVSLKWTFQTGGSVSKGAGFAFSHLVNAGMQLGLMNAFRSLGLGRLTVRFFLTRGDKAAKED